MTSTDPPTILRIARGAPLPEGTTLVMPDSLRGELGRSLGPIVDEDGAVAAMCRGGPLATVGDMCTASMHRRSVSIHLAVIDDRTRRRDEGRWRGTTREVGERHVTVRSAQGELSAELYNAVIEAWASSAPTRIDVEGEEDLAALAAILHAPEGATVIYGIPDKGLALVQVDARARKAVVDVLVRFLPRT
jgi:uncharacterized protein (UPF0218 family)